jgi:hypothetical protein
MFTFAEKKEAEGPSRRLRRKAKNSMISTNFLKAMQELEDQHK